MRLAALLARLCGGRSLARDLRDEVDFHIAMRAAAYVRDGMTADDAATLARKQFGNVEAIMNDMRQTRLRSSRAVFVAVTTASIIVAALWVYAERSARTPVQFPAPALPMTFVKRPPPPPPPPTWEEFVAKGNTFGDGSARRRRR
jgi:hypothetical protein